MIGIKDIFKGGAEGVISGLTNGAANIISKVKADPTKALEYEKELKELEAQAALKMQELSNEAEKILLADISNAREREIQLAKDEHTPMINKIITPILGLRIVASTFFLWGMILFRHYEPKNSESMVIGSLTTICASVIGYYFGSSTGSHAKQKQIEKLTK